MEEKKEALKSWLPIMLSVLSLIFGGGWFQQYQKTETEKIKLIDSNKKEKIRLKNDYLVRISTILADNKVVIDELNNRYLERGWGVLESYLIKTRRNGIKANSLMRERINTLVENNSTLLTLLESYKPYAITTEFKEQASIFRNHAIRYRDRWKSVPEIIDTSETLPVALPFPSEFTNSVEVEMSKYNSFQ